MKKYLFYISALLLTFGPKMSAAPTTTPNSLQVEVLIYSGRPNPVFNVTDPAEINEITGLVNALPKNSAAAAEAPAEQPVLGYRGIAVKNLSATSPELESLVVKRSNVHVNRKASPQAKTALAPTAAAAAVGAGASAPAAGASELRVDGGGVLERRLLGLARSRGVVDDALVNHINNTK